MQAMIFAAGLGTRLKPYTNTMPKAMVPLCGKPLLWHAINKLKNTGITHIIINVHHFADQIINYLKENNNFDITIKISDETNMLLDTGGGLKYAEKLFIPNTPILVYNVDILSDINLNKLKQHHLESENLATLVTASRNTSRYLLFNNSKLIGWTNKNTNQFKWCNHSYQQYTEMAFAGIQIVNPEFINLIEPNKKVSIIDEYLRIGANNKIGLYNNDGKIWMDLGKPEQLKMAEEFILSNTTSQKNPK